DPRVPELESAQLVKDLREGGVKVDYVVYEDEGHDVLRFKNRVHCYNAITEFFRKNLGNYARTIGLRRSIRILSKAEEANSTALRIWMVAETSEQEISWKSAPPIRT